jgi:hypothetical protein
MYCLNTMAKGACGQAWAVCTLVSSTPHVAKYTHRSCRTPCREPVLAISSEMQFTTLQYVGCVHTTCGLLTCESQAMQAGGHGQALTCPRQLHGTCCWLSAECQVYCTTTNALTPCWHDESPASTSKQTTANTQTEQRRTAEQCIGQQRRATTSLYCNPVPD